MGPGFVPSTHSPGSQPPVTQLQGLQPPLASAPAWTWCPYPPLKRGAIHCTEGFVGIPPIIAWGEVLDHSSAGMGSGISSASDWISLSHNLSIRLSFKLTKWWESRPKDLEVLAGSHVPGGGVGAGLTLFYESCTHLWSALLTCWQERADQFKQCWSQVNVRYQLLSETFYSSPTAWLPNN